MQLKVYTLLAFILIFAPIPLFAQNEQLTITTYYPSPYGSYDELTTAGDTYLATRAGSKVGIGTEDPQAPLEISGGAHWAPLRIGGTKSTGVGLDLLPGSAYPGYSIWAGGADHPNKLYISRKNTVSGTNDLMVFDSAGNVGIGTPSPNARLDVNGTIKITDGSQGANKVLTSDANGLASWASPMLNPTVVTCDSADDGGSSARCPDGTHLVFYATTLVKIDTGPDDSYCTVWLTKEDYPWGGDDYLKCHAAAGEDSKACRIYGKGWCM